MRVIAGKWRGRRIEEPRGRDVTRPTTDRVREACASMLDSALDEGIEGARVLDAFGGSGAMGIEMLSRGAAFAAFFDIDRGACALIKRNLETFRADRGSYNVITGDVLAWAGRGRIPGAPFDAVLIDPPYALGADPAEDLLEALAAHGLVSSGAVALFEHRADMPGARPQGFELVRQRRYGTTMVDLLCRSDASGNASQEGMA